MKPSIRRSAHAFTDDRLVVVGVVEAFHAYFVPRVDIGRNRAVGIEGEYFRVDIHLVVIVRIVLEGIDFVGEAALERLPEVDIRLVGVERAIRVGGIQEPAVALLLGDDVDDAPDGIRSEADRHDTLVNLDAFGETSRNVVQSE